MLILISAVTLIAGYFIGAFVGIPRVNNDQLSGAIGKASKHKSTVSGTDIAAIENKLRNDADFLAQTSYCFAYMSSRISEFKQNVAYTLEVVSLYPEFEPYKTTMGDLLKMASNAETSASAALESLSKIIEGDKKVNYEEAANNAAISYALLDRGLSLSRSFIADANSFLKDKKVQDYQNLAFIRDRWVEYNYIEAVLTEDNTLMSLWAKEGCTLDPKATTACFLNTSDEFRLVANNAGFFNIGLMRAVSENDKLGIVPWVSSNGILGRDFPAFVGCLSGKFQTTDELNHADIIFTKDMAGDIEVLFSMSNPSKAFVNSTEKISTTDESINYSEFLAKIVDDAGVNAIVKLNMANVSKNDILGVAFLNSGNTSLLQLQK